jgi:hypothetical protein
MRSLYWLLVLATIHWAAWLCGLQSVSAEPWISNRFAQNCAGCHAPGRKNLEPMDRRCTLACQGCHVNPNGGGMRSSYGRWNENRWLRSFVAGRNEWKAPAPYAYQPYAKPLDPKEASALSELEIRKKKFRAKKRRKPKTTPNAEIAKAQSHPEPSDLRLLELVDPPEKEYDRSDGLEHIISADSSVFLAQIPDLDPYQELDLSKFDGGADLRWQMARGLSKYSDENGVQERKIWASFLMNIDLGIRWRPFNRGLHVVYEGRYLGSPDSKKSEDVMATLQRRNLYVMADDLPFNSYAMAGYYRPLFGHYTPDHTSLSQQLLSTALQENTSIYGLSYLAASVGASPNVPYANIHYVGRQLGLSPNETHSGVAVNLGGRFVTLGLSPNYSYWNSQKKEVVANENVVTKLQMHSLGIGAQIFNTTVNLETIYFLKDRPNDAYLQANSFGIETYHRYWRENYVFGSYTGVNTAADFKPGTVTQLRFGIRSFLTSGLDIMFFSSVDDEEKSRDINRSPSDQNTQTLNGQIHLSI